MKGLVAATGEFIDIGPAHPVADLFPMLAGEDLEELVASINEQGLLQPVVIDDQGRVLDGRNRLAACERLDVIPEVTVYDGEDPDGYALTVNLARRHLSKGQRAMVTARAGSRNYTEAQVSKQYVSWARQVLDHAPDLTDAVIAGARSLDDAYKVAQDRKKASTNEAAQMAKLHAEAPDLADLVAEERVTLAEAMGALRQRQAERKRDIESARSAATSMVADLQARVVSIIIGVRHGEPRLIDKAMVRQLRDAIDQLEELL